MKNQQEGASRGGAYQTDPERGLFAGKEVARCFTSPDGMTVLVGRSAKDNDIVTFKLSRPNDFWFHVAAQSGSHVLVKNPDSLDRLPRETLEFAAGLAARHSGARSGGKVDVTYCQVRDVNKARGAPAGQVNVRRTKNVKASPDDA